MDAELLEKYGSALAGLTFYEPYTPFELATPAIETYHEAVANYAPQLTDPDQTLALAAYINADMMIRGLQEGPGRARPVRASSTACAPSTTTPPAVSSPVLTSTKTSGG
nr:ABC transporter substrate-binding protein [Micromonospora sp. DSM 115978]